MELNTSGIIGKSPALTGVFTVLSKVAPTDSTVLVTGESGTGKELLVRALHANSRRRDKPFVPVNCGAIPRELLESELFGHEKGAFTHAIRNRAGRFELADGGTIFLDEIGEMDLSLQVKILRVLQEKEFERVGGTRTMKVDVRIVAATNRDLEAEVAAGRFREDLFYRLNVIPLHLPPLRERGEDVLLLSRCFLERFCAQKERPVLAVPAETSSVFLSYSWPGNVRELENLMERLSILCDEDHIRPEDLPRKIWDDVGKAPPAPAAVPAARPAGFDWPVVADLKAKGMGLKEFLDEIEERLLAESLEMAGGVKNQAAEILGIKRTTLIEKLKKKNMLGA
ncbi:Transcriptional regulatory protein ZraR [Fundidesulfovibrio magnetotacticus]|uniref:Transcriptional regulatory protein ZraR n=1 Tax=Fundidesulfovibrio magnetotacticus TaxID=2730080 RepID=A0A6V8LQ99_9BACT|nr:sigma-54 dependent transcriptional regulator [Fundidesulfovibrio magnetotacticus]GFK92731.1 Transcriptional regulatory protein ZraR [Fundidesulfovibrio magnetotacticus]